LSNSEKIGTENVDVLKLIRVFSDQSRELPIFVTHALLNLSGLLKINKIRFVPSKNTDLPSIWIENNTQTNVNTKWIEMFRATINFALDPFKLHPIHNMEIPITNGGYILLGKGNNFIGTLVIKMIDVEGKKLEASLIDTIDAISKIFTSLVLSKIHNKETKIQGSSEDKFSHYLENQQKDIAKDLIEGIAHGVANPLAVILANQEILEEFISSIDNFLEETNNDDVKVIKNELNDLFIDQRSAIDRLNHLLTDLRQYSQASIDYTYRTNLNQAIEQGVNLSQLRADLRNRIALDMNGVYTVQATQFGISQALFHILKYFAEISSNTKSSIHISIDNFDSTEDSYLKIIIRMQNNGESFNDNNLDFVVASQYIKGYGGLIETKSTQSRLQLIMKLLPDITNN
jgi:hypothetical protein